MKRTMIDTSLQAYETITPHINRKQKEVLEAMFKLHEATNQEIADSLGWPIHKVTPRTGELIKLGKLERTIRTEKAWKMKLIRKEVQLQLAM